MLHLTACFSGRFTRIFSILSDVVMKKIHKISPVMKELVYGTCSCITLLQLINRRKATVRAVDAHAEDANIVRNVYMYVME